VEFKLGLDGRPFWGHGQVMVGITCMSEGEHYGSQCPTRVFPLVIVNGKEEYELLKTVLKPITDTMAKLLKEGIHVLGEHYDIHFKGIPLFLSSLLSPYYSSVPQNG